MNMQNQLCGAGQPQQESPIQRANGRFMSAQNETEKLISELKMRISVILRPSTPSPCDPGSVGSKCARELAAPLTDGTNDRAAQQEAMNFDLRDILARIEL